MYSQILSSPSTRPATNVILYYHLTASHLPTVRQAIGSGVDVACLTADAAAREDAADGVCFLGASALPYYWDVVETEALIGLVETVFEALAHRSTLLSWLRRLYNSLDIDYYFRRVLLNELGQLLSVASLASGSCLSGYDSLVLASGWPSSRLWPLFITLWHQDETRPQLAAHLPSPICAALDRLAIAGEQGIVGKVKRYGRALYHMVRIWFQVLRQIRPYAFPLQPSQLLLRTYASDLNINLGGQDRLRNIDFLVDGKELPKEKVAFWVERGVSEERQQALLQRGYRLLSADAVVFSPSVFARRVLPLLLSFTGLLRRMIKEGCWWCPHVSTLVYCYLIWQEVYRQVQPAVFFCYNDISPTGVARNIVLRQHGCRSVFYQHSCNSPMAPSGRWTLNMIYSYLAFDAIADWGPKHSDLIRCHPGAISEYWEVGCLWSEHARLVREDPKVRKNYVDQVERYGGVKLSDFRKVVGVLDTAISSMLSHDDMYSFLAGNLELAHKMRDVLFLYKPKYPFAEPEPGEPVPLIEAWGSRGRELWGGICSMPNFVVLPWLFEVAAVLGLADVVISACFTSTTVEAIGCGKRAIYYDPTDRLPHAFWCRIPGMVCVTEEELYNRVCYLLWDCDEETYTNYLRTHCMGIEGHFDGKAITRLRSRILDVMNGRRSVTAIDG